ncbi:hypothetical protein Ddye_015222 [Dipteronia dyeriana]|uniref:Uncharacterized protein n=1 Tax=Dipteronia dyeriana TaxID=168575 RepID=A0AAD9WYY8_9ROSI|nr:hypothetical protein Ddye_015222 [Dipteronia dyeriana]
MEENKFKPSSPSSLARSQSPTPSAPSRRSCRPPSCQLPIPISNHSRMVARIACWISDHRRLIHRSQTSSCSIDLRPLPPFASRCHRSWFMWIDFASQTTAAVRIS